MNHTAFLSNLPAPTRTRLTGRSTMRGLAHLAGHGGALGLTGAAIAAHLPFWPVLLPVHGVLLVFLFTLEHECTHRTPFASDRLCDAVGHLCGALIVNPFTWFRAFHLAHHRHTNQEGDPELASPAPRTRREWLWHVSGLPLWWAQTALLARLATGRETPAYLPARLRKRSRNEARVLIALYALALATLAVSPLVLWLWLVPLALGQPALRLYLLAEHGDCPRVADMFTNTRTTFSTGVVRFVAWNMPYHTEHHVFPAVPFHNLPALHRLMRDHLGVTAPGYRAFTRSYLARRR